MGRAKKEHRKKVAKRNEKIAAEKNNSKNNILNCWNKS